MAHDGRPRPSGGRRHRAEARARRRAERRARRGRLLVWVLVLTVGVVGMLFLAVYPARTFWAQRTSIEQAQQELDELRAEGDRLEARARALDTDEEIERLARTHYDLVRPGEQVFAVLPPVETPPSLGYWDSMRVPLGP